VRIQNFNIFNHQIISTSPRRCVKEEGDGYKAWSLVAVKSPNLDARAELGLEHQVC
jgi:hypothetical protein